ncbi:MAG: hypothetical protein AAF191_06435 [Verrucomicrobiota bacterium]
MKMEPEKERLELPMGTEIGTGLIPGAVGIVPLLLLLALGHSVGLCLMVLLFLVSLFSSIHIFRTTMRRWAWLPLLSLVVIGYGITRIL